MPSDDRELLAIVVRMVAPMRREFGQILNVQHFLSDPDYAQDVLNKALGSQDARMREHARYANYLRAGPRLLSAGKPDPTPPVPVSSPALAQTTASVQQQTSAMESNEDEVRARIMAKYTSGLR